MGRVDISAFSEQEVTRVCAAAGPAQLTKIENVLTAHKVDYAVEVESYRESAFSFSVTEGAIVYVAAAQAPEARQHLTAAGIPVGVVDEDLYDD